MIRTDSAYEACYKLFAEYPLAVTDTDFGGRTRSMVLMLRKDNEIRFFVLSHDCEAHRSSFWLFPWHTNGITGIEPGGNVPGEAANAVKYGIPIPRDGSLFGWISDKAVTALVTVRARYTPTSRTPSWAAMPLVDIPEAQWPPFTGKRLFGQWFWKHYRAGNLISVADLIAKTCDTVFWVDTRAVLGSDCCAVTRDVVSPDGYTLRQGWYVYYKALRKGKHVPSLAILRANAAITDLAPLFRPHEHDQLN
jgi:hypothetical protein